VEKGAFGSLEQELRIGDEQGSFAMKGTPGILRAFRCLQVIDTNLCRWRCGECMFQYRCIS